MRDESIQQDRDRGVFFTQDWMSMPAVMPVASGGIHIWHMPALVDIFGDVKHDDSVLNWQPLPRSGNR